MGLSRNGGHGSIEESEIKNLSRVARGFGVISGRAILHREQAKKHHLYTTVRGPRGVPFVILCNKSAGQQRQPTKTTPKVRTRIIHITIFGNSLVTAAWPLYVSP